MEKRVTLQDIARRCSTSAVTVSKALNGEKGVSRELREEILKTSREMGYVKVRRAANMRISRTIGVITAARYLREKESFYWPLYRQLASKIQERQSTSVLEVIDESDERALVLPKLVRGSGIDGIIVMGSFSRSYMDVLYHEPPQHIPLICLDSEIGPERGDAVVADNIGGGYEVTHHLLEMGHSRIGFIGTLLKTSSIDNRYLGYVKALMELGIPMNPSWVIDDRDRESGELLSEKELLGKTGLPAAEHENNMMNRPTAYFCNCDRTAFQLIEALSRNGIRVPEDISVAGFDNYMPHGLSEEGITTYAIDLNLMVSKAVSRILYKIEKPASRGGIFVAGGRLVLRSSVRRVGVAVPRL